MKLVAWAYSSYINYNEVMIFAMRIITRTISLMVTANDDECDDDDDDDDDDCDDNDDDD